VHRSFDAERVPFDVRGLQPVLGGKRWPLDLGGRRSGSRRAFHGQSTRGADGADVDSAPVTAEGPLIERHRRFSATRERGLHCRFSAHAHPAARMGARERARRSPAAPAPAPRLSRGIREGLLEDSVEVDTRGGRLTIRWRGGDNSRV